MLTPGLQAAQDSELEREVRFAVVIYGGVSLAIYINGIVQEMLHLVRSTAIEETELSPVEQVYRKLANRVGTPERANDGLTLVQTPTGKKTSRASSPLRPGKAALRKEDAGNKIHTKFVVDILSGTSAGGINAVYLAKALANNLNIESLARMWITEADLNLLMNDTKIDPSYLQQVPPPSLLNGKWMYLKLLQALNAMNPDATALKSRIVSSLVDDLDLYCTSTDLYGLPVEIALTDENVKEERFRNFYHFKRRIGASGSVADDFTTEMDPFLAFAARCTSSFPFAFEPMELGDIADIVDSDSTFRQYRSLQSPESGIVQLFGKKIAKLSGAAKFAEICSIYQSIQARDQIDFQARPFGDGGYLDNKPFTYAIETLKQRHADLPVDRKLIYIEPGPENLDAAGLKKKAKNARPNAIENSLDALVTLPRYETIRQDIENVIEWNADIARLHRVLDDINKEIEKASSAISSQTDHDDSNYQARDAYLRLRLSSSADQLTCALAQSIHVDTFSAEGQALRSMVGEWRATKFTLLSDEQKFLDLFDFDFCERAIRFLRTQLQLLPEDHTRKEALESLADITRRFMGRRNRQLGLSLSDLGDGQAAFDCWTQYLRFIVDPKAAALALDEKFPNPSSPQVSVPPASPLAELFQATDQGRDARVSWLFENWTKTEILSPSFDAHGKPLPRYTFQEIIGCIGKQISEVYGTITQDDRCKSDPQFVPPNGMTPLQYFMHCMIALFGMCSASHTSALDRFVLQDTYIYPIVFGTSLGEFEPVDIFRISPQDTTPIAGTAPEGSKTPSPPLRGASLGAFGAFLDQDWRMNDMLRGRLDGAERLITAILPDSDARTMAVREDLIRQAQEAVAEEWEVFRKDLNLKRPAAKQKLVDKIPLVEPEPSWTRKTMTKVSELDALLKDKTVHIVRRSSGRMKSVALWCGKTLHIVPRAKTPEKEQK
jgi:patatin-related protein